MSFYHYWFLTLTDAFMLANTMLASVNIFESLSDVNSKYSKIVDREYDTISNDVKRWFKKLTVKLYLAHLRTFVHCVLTERGKNT